MKTTSKIIITLIIAVVLLAGLPTPSNAAGKDQYSRLPDLKEASYYLVVYSRPQTIGIPDDHRYVLAGPLVNIGACGELMREFIRAGHPIYFYVTCEDSLKKEK
jgi:hypothetical protein